MKYRKENSIPLSKEEVREMMEKENKLLFDNKLIINFLVANFCIKHMCLYSYMELDVEFYEILLNGVLMVYIEYDKNNEKVVLDSVVAIDDKFMKKLNNIREKTFFKFAKEVYQEEYEHCNIRFFSRSSK